MGGTLDLNSSTGEVNYCGHVWSEISVSALQENIVCKLI